MVILCCRQSWRPKKSPKVSFIYASVNVSAAAWDRDEANVTPNVTEIWTLQELLWSAERLQRAMEAISVPTETSAARIVVVSTTELVGLCQ